MASRVVTSWMAVFGTSVDSRALEMTFEMAMNDSVDSFPPARRLMIVVMRKINHRKVPFRIAAFPDLMAREAILAMTSGRASKIIRSTPIGHDTLSSSSPSSSLVLRVTLPTSNFHVSEARYVNRRVTRHTRILKLTNIHNTLQHILPLPLLPKI